jgi:hypothetical protein
MEPVNIRERKSTLQLCPSPPYSTLANTNPTLEYDNFDKILKIFNFRRQ